MTICIYTKKGIEIGYDKYAGYYYGVTPFGRYKTTYDQKKIERIKKALEKEYSQKTI